MQWAAIPAGPELAIAFLRLRERRLAQHGDDRIVGGAEALQPLEKMSGELDGRELAAAEQPAQLRYGLKREIAHVRAPTGAENTKSGSSPLASSTLRISSALPRPVLI